MKSDVERIDELYQVAILGKRDYSCAGATNSQLSVSESRSSRRNVTY